jgi:hypothetical protein
MFFDAVRGKYNEADMPMHFDNSTSGITAFVDQEAGRAESRMPLLVHGR